MKWLVWLRMKNAAHVLDAPISLLAAHAYFLSFPSYIDKFVGCKSAFIRHFTYASFV